MGDEKEAAYDFEYSGGALCLDFVNTVSDRGTEAIERLTGYGELVRWARGAEVVDAAGADRLADLAADAPEVGEDVLRQALELREALFELFAAAAAGETLPPSALEQVNHALPDTLTHLRLEPSGDGCTWEWCPGRDVEEELTAPLWRVVRSAAELLTSGDLDRVRECDADTCRWLFFDRSRNRSRRWCDMQQCGNRAKARRHYQRHKGRS